MYRIDTPDAVREMPAPNPPGPKPNHYFTNGNPHTGQPGTILQADWANTVQEEISNFVENSGIELNKNSSLQLNDLLQKKSSIPLQSASIVNLGDVPARFVDITGSAAITSFGIPKKNQNTSRLVRFLSPLTLTYNAVSMILPSRQNIITEADDVAEFFHLGDGKWLCTKYEKANGFLVGRSVGFLAHRNGVDQEVRQEQGRIFIKMVINTTLFNEGGYYDTSTSKFTPKVPGNYLVNLQLCYHGLSPTPPHRFYTRATIFKNGIEVCLKLAEMDMGNYAMPTVSSIIPMNGSTDYLEAYTVYSSNPNPAKISGAPSLTFFSAIKIN